MGFGASCPQDTRKIFALTIVVTVKRRDCEQLVSSWGYLRKALAIIAMAG
jgi:hypothetical protein